MISGLILAATALAAAFVCVYWHVKTTLRVARRAHHVALCRDRSADQAWQHYLADPPVRHQKRLVRAFLDADQKLTQALGLQIGKVTA